MIKKTLFLIMFIPAILLGQTLVELDTLGQSNFNDIRNMSVSNSGNYLICANYSQGVVFTIDVLDPSNLCSIN